MYVTIKEVKLFKTVLFKSGIDICTNIVVCFCCRIKFDYINTI